MFIPWLNFITHYFATLVHEIGHSITYWLFGYPSIPAFDFIFGGGVTIHYARSDLLAIIVSIALPLAILYFKKLPFRSYLLLLGCPFYLLLATTPLHTHLAIFMGHGTELLFAGLFFYRAIEGIAIRHPWERPLYALLGFYLQLNSIKFAWKLIFDESFKVQYALGKGSVGDHDFTRLANSSGMSVEAVSVLYLLLALTPFAVVWFLTKNKNSRNKTKQ